MDYLMRAVEEAGYEPGRQIAFALDVAASELYNKDSGVYDFPGETRLKLSEAISLPVHRTTEEMISYYEELICRYPIVSIEDGLQENDWDGWCEMTRRLGDRVQLVGDDLFVTNPKRLKEGIRRKAGNAILVKINQIGTLSESFESIVLAKRNGYQTVVSHRSGETEDTLIADIAVAFNCGQIKTGAPCRGSVRQNITNYSGLRKWCNCVITEELFQTKRKMRNRGETGYTNREETGGLVRMNEICYAI